MALIDPRIFPDGFLRTYRETLGGEPPREFLEAYEVLADTFYFGTGLAYEDAGQTKGGSLALERGYTFKEPRLFRFKWSVDRRLRALAYELRSWAVSREGAGPGGAVPPRAQQGHLDEPRDARAPEPDREA